jgi:hypothetical protein
LDNGPLTLSKLLPTIILGSLLFSACRKEALSPVIEPKASCVLQIDNPTGRSYTTSSLYPYTCTSSLCGFLPLNNKNYWVYEDSVFKNGEFLKVQLDTLRYVSKFKTNSDGLVWWESNISVGLPDILYANDSSTFDLNERLFTPGYMDVKKDYSLFAGDSIRYLTSFDDNAAIGRSLKLSGAVESPAGNFYDCIYFEKNARNYRRDQVYFSRGLGVIKYIYEKAMPGTRVVQLQQVSTLVSYHIE